MFKKMGYAACILEIVVGTILSIALLFGYTTGYGLKAQRVEGLSMYPTLNNNSPILTINLPNQTYEVGDIVCISNKNGALSEVTDDAKTSVIKRIVAVEGDTVTVIGGRVYVNGVENTDFPYEEIDYYKYVNFEVTLAKDEYFVLGDNRSASADSRAFGEVTSKDITDKLIIHF